MNEHERTTKTCACMNAIPNSRLEKATIKPNGKAPNRKNINPEFMIL